MRKTILGAFAAFALAAAPAYAQSTTEPAPATPAPGGTEAPAPESPPAAAPTIKSVNIVDITELPPETQTRVNEAVERGGESNLQQLRASIDATPTVADALKAKGLTSAQVIAAAMDQNGTLTLITKKSS